MGQFLLLPVKMLLLLSCLAATSLASLRPMTLASSLSPTTEWSTTAAPTQTRRPPGAPLWWTPNTVVTNRWGDCSTSQFSNCPEDTPDLPSCTAESGASCVFPFRHEGITYNSCASTDLLSSAWCSTSTHENGTHILGSESLCPSTCPGATTTTTTTTSTTTTASTSTTTTATTTITTTSFTSTT